MSRRGFLKNVGSTGIGFAYAKTGNRSTPRAATRINASAGRISEPNGSISGLGFSVSRPQRFAVGSPSRTATNAWAYSCRTSAGTSEMPR